MSINVTVSGGTGIDAAPETTVDVQGGIGPAAFVNHLGEVVGVNPIVAGPGITITTASGTLTISGRSDGDVASLSPVLSVNNYTGEVALNVQDLTAAAAVHTHSTTDVTGLTATIQQYGNVTSVNSYTGEVTLTVQDLTAAAAVHTHSTTEVTGLTATIQQYGKVLSVNSYTGDVTLTVQDLTAAAAVHTHSTTEVTGLTATIQQYGNVTSVNNYTGDVTLTMQDLGDVSSSPPSIGDALLWNGTEWSGASLGETTTQAAAEISAGHGLFVDEDGSLATVSDPPRDVDLAAVGNNSLKATFFRDRPGDLSRGLASYEVDFIAVGSLPAVVVAEQSPAASRTMDVQGVLQDGDSFAELGVSSDNGATWNNVTLAPEDDSGVVAIKSVPAGSQRAGERLYRIRSADTVANLSLATYSQNISATYNVNGYYPPLPLQIYNSGDSLTAIAAFNESDVERPEINLSAANVTVGIELMAAGSEPTYAFTGLAVDYPRYFDDDPIYSENNAVYQSLVTTSSEGGWVSAFLRAGGEEGVGDQYESGSLTYYFAGNYSLPKSPDDVFPGVFLVADAVSATNLPAGVTAGEWSGGVGVTSDSPSYYHLAYRPDPSQEFEYADGSTSVVTLTAKVSSVEDAAMRLYVESQTMFASNDQNANQTFTTEPTITLELRDQSSVLVANATSTDIAGNALAALAANLVGQQVYDLTATVSNPAGGRGYIPMIKFDPVALEAT